MFKNIKRFVIILMFSITFISPHNLFAKGHYSESPSMTQLVKEGKIPNVDKRLPVNPVVYNVKQIGKYGGTLRTFQFGHPDRWHIWNSSMRQGLVKIPPTMESISENGIRNGMLPNIVKNWKWSSNGKELIINIRKGIKWSDGHLFTADDILFVWKDHWLNAEYQKNPPSTVLVGGKVPELSKIDQYTLKWKFPAPYVWYMFNVFQTRSMFKPKHYMKQFHPRYNTDAKYKDYLDLDNFWNPNRPTMAPWKMVKYDTTQEIIVERNPFYYAVDQEGNQLPYIDKII